jgi:putative membrane-bound dehydrogenase-like protein
MKKLLSLVAVSLCTAVAAAQDRPLPPQEAPKRMTLPEGFQATLFAGEPDVVQPIAMTFDDRGRLWVVECVSYPDWSDKPEGADRVVMFEDTDGDGKFDKRHVIFDKGANLSGIELGFGGIWLCSIPNLLFIPCDFNADIPKIGKPQAVLDGWTLKCKHNVFNGLAWGPDGWLYGCSGIIDLNKVGKPGTPEQDRIPMNCGVWRYHPTRKVFEPFAHGTTNPFGLDFDKDGECFITNCVIGHLWHVVPGAHFERMYGQDLNPNVYQLMKTCADHIHWGGGSWTTSRGGKGVHSEAGGGHAHVGCMLYLGDNWPDKYRNGAFMLNLHGSRVNHDRLERLGSGYVAKHEPDFMLANDPWFRGIAIKYGPDGGVFVSDWTDTGECHNYKAVDRTNGRVYKITYGKPKPWQGDLSKLSDDELVKLQAHRNDWQVRHARRLLQERNPAGKEVLASLQNSLTNAKEPSLRLRAMWALHALNALKPAQYLALVGDADEAICTWAYRLFFDEFQGEADMQAFDKMTHPHLANSRIQLAITSGLRRVKSGRDNSTMLLVHAVKDASDQNLPLMTWYAVEPQVAQSPAFSLKCLDATPLAIVRESIARRVAGAPAEDGKKSGLQYLSDWLASAKDVDRQADVLRGTMLALAGQRRVQAPEGWTKTYTALSQSANGSVRDIAMRLAVLFGDAKAIDSLRETVRNRAADLATRQAALRALIGQRDEADRKLLNGLLTDPALRAEAIRSLAAFNDADTPKRLLAIYTALSTPEKEDVVQTLASRPAWTMALLTAIENKQVPRGDVSVFIARQIQGLKDKQVQEKLTKVWGQIQPASKEKVELTAKYKKLLTPEFLKAADLSKGRLVFAKNCAACHRLYDDGGNIGPALTGSQRANLEYVLENVLDPSAVVATEYRMSKIVTASGRTINGIIKLETDKAITIQTPNEVIVLPKDDIESRAQSPLSMMPEGILEKLAAEEVRDLVAYLASKDQAPLPPQSSK